MTIALQRPFLKSLVHVSRRLFYLPEEDGKRVALVRDVARALKSGTPVLTFPAGHIEPDPDVFPGALESLTAWTESAEVFVRLAPGIPVVPVCVRGVTWRTAAHHPLTGMRETPEDRQLLASALQLLWQLLFGSRPVTVRVQIGVPILPPERQRFDGASFHAAVLEEMRQLITTAPSGIGESAL
jgi:hypothetical protein